MENTKIYTIIIHSDLKFFTTVEDVEKETDKTYKTKHRTYRKATLGEWTHKNPSRYESHAYDKCSIAADSDDLGFKILSNKVQYLLTKRIVDFENISDELEAKSATT